MWWFIRKCCHITQFLAPHKAILKMSSVICLETISTDYLGVQRLTSASSVVRAQSYVYATIMPYHLDFYFSNYQ